MNEATTFTPAERERIELDARRVEDIAANLESAALTDQPEVAVGRALAILATTATGAFIPRLDPAIGRRLAAMFSDLVGPLRRTSAGEIDADDIRAGISAASAMARTFGRDFDELRDFIGDELLLDRIGNVVRLSNSLQNLALKRASIARGEPHRRGLPAAVR